MNSQHADPAALTVRPGAEVKEAASRVLSDRRLEMRSFIVACLTALAADPAGFLAALEPYWPPRKPRGRPRRGEHEQRQAAGSS